MATTFALDSTRDLSLDASGNVAVLTGASALAQDAASAAMTYRGECYLDTSIGVPWTEYVLGRQTTLALVKQLVINAALTVPGVAAAQFKASSIVDRELTGQVQVVEEDTAAVAAATISVVDPQGVG